MNGEPSTAKSLRFNDHMMWVDLNHGRVLGVPLAWFPVLLDASPFERSEYEISASGNGLHWEALDEDISLEGLLEGWGDQTKRRRATRSAAE